MGIEEIFTIKKADNGIIVKGRDRESNEALFDDLMQKLSEFYFGKEQNLVFVSQRYVPEQGKYVCDVFHTDNPEYDFELGVDGKGNQTMKTIQKTEPRKYGTVSVYIHKRDTGARPRDRKADYAVAWTHWDKPKMGVYFNPVGKSGKADKEQFEQHARR